MDSLHIKGLSLATRIGVYDWEQRIAQKLLIDIIIPLDVTTCQDDIANTVDYDKLCQLVTTYVEGQAFKLIETVAQGVAELIKTHFTVKEVTVRVSKPHAVKNAGDIQVQVVR